MRTSLMITIANLLYCLPRVAPYNHGGGNMAASIATLTEQIDNEIIRALGLPLDGWLADRLHAILGRATRRFSELFAEVDRIVEEQGLPAGAAWLLHHLASGVESRGVDNIPSQGPLIIASNHPGAVDSLAVV